MNQRHVKGKRIVRVEQMQLNPRDDNGKTRVLNVKRIILDDGTEMIPVVGETDWGFYTVDFVVVYKKPKTGGPHA